MVVLPGLIISGSVLDNLHYNSKKGFLPNIACNFENKKVETNYHNEKEKETR